MLEDEMEDKINQILKNQATIFQLIIKPYSLEDLNSVHNRMNETRELLQPKETKDLPSRTADALKEGCGKIIQPHPKVKMPCGDLAGGEFLYCDDCVNTKEKEDV